MRTSLRVSAATPPKSRSHQHAVPLTQRNQEVPYCHCRAPPKRIQTQQTFLDRSESDLSLRTASRSELSERLSPTASLAATPRESFLTGICFDTTVSESTTFSILTGCFERLAEFIPEERDLQWCFSIVKAQKTHFDSQNATIKPCFNFEIKVQYRE